MSLSQEELIRYSRHISLDEIGKDGQLTLKSSKVLCVGIGGLGNPALLYLVAAGVGTIGLIDHDVVQPTNLQRQVLYTDSNIGQSKVSVAKATLQQRNPYVNILTFEEKLSKENANNIISKFDVVIDCTDNFMARYLINDVCCSLSKPNVFASIFQFEGQSSVFCTQDGPCYRCLYPEPPSLSMSPSCTEAGVLGVLPGIMGLIQATETIKYILKLGDTLIGKLLNYNALEMNFQKYKINRRPNCPSCALKISFTQLPRYELIENKAELDYEITPADLLILTKKNNVLLVDVRELYEREAYHIGGVHIPLNELELRASELGRNILIVTYCMSGARSKKALEILYEKGFKNLKHLQGGIENWIGISKK